MKIGVLGTGNVAQTLAASLLATDNEVMLGTRNPANAPAPLAQWLTQHPGARLGTFAEAAAFGELLLNATLGSASLLALQTAGADALGSKVLLDVANPLDFSKGMPPTLSPVNDDSLGEVIQRAFPNLKVVKALNTMAATIMVNPAALNGDHVVFVSGNDAAAKATATAFLAKQFGWKPTNVIDLGDITTARGSEQLLPIWVRLWGALQTPMFNFAIVRQAV